MKQKRYRGLRQAARGNGPHPKWIPGKKMARVDRALLSSLPRTVRDGQGPCPGRLVIYSTDTLGHVAIVVIVVIPGWCALDMAGRQGNAPSKLA